MSADNGIAVLRTVYTGNEGTSSYEYRVAHYFASATDTDDDAYHLFKDKPVYLERQTALAKAHDMNKEMGTEYGVTEWEVNLPFHQLQEQSSEVWQ